MNRSLDTRLFRLVLAAIALAMLWHNAGRLVDLHSPLHRIAETNRACLADVATALESAERAQPGTSPAVVPETLREC